MEWVLGILLAGSSLVQGGFYPTAFLAAGLLCAVTALLRGGPRPLPAEYALWIFASLYILTSLLNGYDASGLAQASLPLCAALFLRCVLSLPADKRGRLVDVTVLFSGLLSLLAVASLSGLLPLKGAAAAGRLQYPFQYANAAGAWYGCVSLLSLERNGKMTSWARLPILAALFLTRSVGAVGTYGLCVLIWVLTGGRTEKWGGAVTVHAAGLGLALLAHYARGALSLPVLALAVLASLKLETVTDLAKKIKLHWILLPVLAAGAVLLLGTGRAASAVSTFAERLIQIRDGLTAAADRPLSGFGAGNWTRIRPLYQSAQYASSVIHASLVQYAADGGLLTALAFAAFAVLALRTQGRRLPETLAAGAVLFHSLFDFTLQFFPILALLLLALFSGAPGEPAGSRGGRAALRGAAGLAAALFLFLGGAKQAEKSVLLDGGDRNWQAALAKYEKYAPLLGSSPQARLICGHALLFTGKPELVPELYAGETALTTEELALTANALDALHETDRAYELILDALDRRLSDTELFEWSAGFLTDHGADGAYREAYNDLVRRANSQVTRLGALTGAQVQIQPISRKEENK